MRCALCLVLEVKSRKDGQVSALVGSIWWEDGPEIPEATAQISFSVSVVTGGGKPDRGGEGRTHFRWHGIQAKTWKLSAKQPGEKGSLHRGHDRGRGSEARRLGVHVGWRGAGGV